MKYVIPALALVMLFASRVEAAEQSGQLAGTIVGRDSATNQLTVSHGAVAGIMGAMTMPYEVRGQKVSSLPADGANITATLHESNGTFWLTDVRAAQAPAAASPHQHGSEPVSPAPAMDHGAMQHGAMGGMQMHGAAMHGTEMQHDATSELLMRQASGTSMNPAAAPMHMSMFKAGDWNVMLHGLAFVNQVQQTGPRGDDKFFSTNWVMGMADRELGGGRLMLRSMLSLEPATVGDKYPELFQTGEVLDGRPIIDAQHPHDFFMEVAAEYARPLSAGTIGYFYAALHGDPALGPVAYPHRASASEIPQGTLGHHVEDSTHIAGSVVTLGAQSGRLGYAVSGFHGREPDEHRWDFDMGTIDSWAARLTFDPTPNWTAQVSTGHMKHPEQLEPGDVQRTTASVAYSGATSFGQWDTSLVFGHNDKSEGPSTSAWLAESVLQFGGRNYVTGRAEIVDKDELFHGQDVPPEIESGVFRIRALTLGYTRDVLVTNSFSGAVGANVTGYSVPKAIQPYYGSSPHSVYVFLRLRGGAAMGPAMKSGM